MASTKPDSALDSAPTPEDYPIYIIGDYAVDTLVPDAATVPLNTKDPALWTLGEINDDLIKPVPGGAWFQHRMMRSLAVAWDRWRDDLNQHILKEHRPTSSAAAQVCPYCPPVKLSEYDMERLLGNQPSRSSCNTLHLKPPSVETNKKPKSKVVPIVNDPLNIQCSLDATREEHSIKHNYLWRLERRPQNNPVDDKDSVFRSTSITPRREQARHLPDQLGLKIEETKKAKAASLLVIGDYDLDFRYLDIWKPGKEKLNLAWQDAIAEDSGNGLPRRIILLGGTLPGVGIRKFRESTAGGKKAKSEDIPETFWDFVERRNLYEGTVMVAGMDMLRLAGADIAYDQSWDRILEDFNREMQESDKLRELLRYEHLVVRIGVTGAIYNYNPNPGQTSGGAPHKTLLIYNPDAPKVWFRAPDAQGNILGLRSAFATCIAARFREGWRDDRMWRDDSSINGEDDPFAMISRFPNEKKPAALERARGATQQLLHRGIKDAICFTQELYKQGYGTDASKVDQMVDGEHFAQVYSKTVLNGDHTSFDSLIKKNDQAAKNVVTRRLPQRSRCIAHVHAPVDDSSMEWGIMRNMLRIGIPEHLETSRAIRMAKDSESSQALATLVDDKSYEFERARKEVEKQIQAYSEQRRLGIATHIVRNGEASVMNRNDKHYEYQRVLECMPRPLHLGYSGDSAQVILWYDRSPKVNQKWLAHLSDRITEGTENLSSLAAATRTKQLTKIEEQWTKAAKPEQVTISEGVKVAGMSTQAKSDFIPEHWLPPEQQEQLHFFPLKKSVDEWDLPHYVALELWVQTTKLYRAETNDDSERATVQVLRQLVDTLRNYLRLLLWVYPCQAPVARFGKFTAIDQCNVESFANIRNLLINHVRSNASKPLNVAVFGGPGSGKSFGVKQIAAELGKERMDVLEFNMTHFLGKADLDAAFLEVSSSLAKGKIPLVFFDEFDCPGPEPVGDFQWLSMFLEPMQDGTYQHAGGALNLRNSILVFAGGRHASYQEFQARVLEAREKSEQGEMRRRKFPDFLSRIRGYVNVPSLNSQRLDEPYSPDERETPYIQRALMVRSVLELNNWCEVNSEGKKGVAQIDFDVVEALLTTSRYHHGKRSIQNLLDMAVRISHKVTKASFPTTHQLNMHTWGSEFRERMQMPGCAWITPYLFVPPRDASVSIGEVYPSWEPVKDWELLKHCVGLNIGMEEVGLLLRGFLKAVCSGGSRVRVRDRNMISAEEYHKALLLRAFEIVDEDEVAKLGITGGVKASSGDHSGPWKKPWEAYKGANGFDFPIPIQKSGKKDDLPWMKLPAVEGLSAAAAKSPDEGVIPLVMLQPVRPVCLRLHYRFEKDHVLILLTSDSTRLAVDLTDDLKGGDGYYPSNIWSEGWSWDKRDKARILRHIIKNAFIAANGPSHWQEYEQRKKKEWDVLKEEAERLRLCELRKQFREDVSSKALCGYSQGSIREAQDDDHS